MHWLLRASVCGCFVGHGMFGIRQKVEWLVFYRPFGVPDWFSFLTMPTIGFMDITLGFIALLRPTRALFIFTAFWGIFTSLLRPFVGMSFFEAVERGGNYGPSIALLLGTAGAALLSRQDACHLSEDENYDRMKNVLVVTVFLLLAGHGALALGAKPLLVKHWAALGWVHINEGGQAFTRMIGALELGAALIVVVWPTRVLCLAIMGWKLFTEALFVTAGDPVWEVLERSGSYGAPLALFVVLSYGVARQKKNAADYRG